MVVIHILIKQWCNMSLKFMITISLLSSSLCFAQFPNEIPGDTRGNIQSTIPEFEIRSILNNVELGIHDNNYISINKYFADNIMPSVPGNEFEGYFNPLLKIENVQLSINGNQAVVDCIIWNQLTGAKIPEQIRFNQSHGQWQIAESELVKEYIIYAQNGFPIETNIIGNDNNKGGTISTLSANSGGYSVKANNFQYITSFEFSNSALIKRPVYGLEQNMNITQKLTYDNLNRFLFDSPIDGKVVNIQNTDYTLSFIADSSWSRIVYGHSKGNWLKSFGDNEGEPRLHWVNSTAADKFGNIFSLYGFPIKIAQMKYEPASENISFIKNIQLPGVLRATDMCLAPNRTPDDINDDSFLVTDYESNAIFEFSLNGQLLGKYTTLRNLLTGEEIYFIRPSQISVIQIYEVAALSVIDFDQKRIILVDKIDGYDGETINCSFVAVRFSDETHVSLKSLSDFGVFNSAIWASDPANGMFHLFSPRSGYLASVKALADGQSQWNHPTNLLHASMSNSPIGKFLGAMSLDSWNENSGISVYYEGSDLIQPSIKYGYESNVPVAEISGTLVTSSVLSLDLYKKNYGSPSPESFVKNINITPERWSGTQKLYSFNTADFNGFNKNGIFIARFYIDPAYSKCYGTDEKPYEQTIQKDILFALPPSGNINPSCYGNEVYCELNILSGSQNYLYKWYRKDFGSDSWTLINDCCSSVRQNMGNKSFYIKCDITDNFNGNKFSFDPVFASARTLSGTLVSDEIWSGSIALTGNIIIPNGIQLTLKPNTVITIPANTSITVNGTLISSGNEFLFTGRSGKLIFDGSSSAASILDGSIVSNAAQIECKNGANVLIQNCTIENCTNGIYIYNSAPRIIGNNILDSYNNGIHGEANGKSPLIKNNIIKKTSHNLNHYQGIYLMNGTNPYITGNDISGYDFGIYYGSGGTGKLTDNNNVTPVINNRLTGNRIGLTVAWGSYLTAGTPNGPYVGGKNSIWGNTSYDATAYQNGTIIGSRNWWGADGVQISNYTGGYINTMLPLTSDPWVSGVLLQLNDQMFEQSEISSSVIDSNLNNIFIGLKLEEEGRNDEAISHYKKMIDKNSHPKFALSSMVKLMNNFGKKEVKDYFGNFSTKSASPNGTKLEADNLLAGIFLDEGNIDKAFALYDKAIINSPNSNEGLNAIFGKFYAAFNLKKDKQLAGQILSNIQSLPLKDADFLMRKQTAEYLYNSETDNIEKSFSHSTVSAENIIKEYALLGNYPNPFNPSTNISYTLPYESSIELIIYDILGREVRAFQIPAQPSGRQEILWDGRNSNGSNVASGVYIYRLILKSLENEDKFEKTAKLMMLK